MFYNIQARLLNQFSPMYPKLMDRLNYRRKHSASASFAHVIRTSILLVIFVGLAACAQTPKVTNTIDLLSDHYFPKHKLYQVETVDEVFELSPQAIDFVNQIASLSYSEKEQVTQLVSAIFDRSNLSIDYVAKANTTARETFEQAAANCLSLTIMVYSMVEHLGLEANFKEVHIPEFWTIREGNTLLNGHINLQVLPKNTYNNKMLRQRPITVDFDPLQGSNRFTSRVLTKKQIVANFYANKAADAMIENNSGLAFRYLKAALQLDKQNEGAWLNLGVLFSRNKLYTEAEAAYHTITESMSNYPTALQNLSVLYRKTGREYEANRISNRLKNKRHSNPYYHKMLGDLAYKDEHFSVALKHYRTAIRLNHEPHEFHFSMAKTYMALGDIKNTRRFLENAKARSDDKQTDAHYASKLSILASL